MDMDFADFILEHDGDDLGRLALARGRFASHVEDFDLALTTLECRRKLRDKVPEWYAVPSLRYPLRVSGEQCSSSATARYKAAVAVSVVESKDSRRSSEHPAGPGTFAAAKVVEGEKAAGDNRGQSPLKPGRIADLTGGLGVDSWAFAQVFDEVLYNEMRPELAQAARHNFAALGMGNITVSNYALAPASHNSSDILNEAAVSPILGDFRPSIIFLDPARRSSDGRKVFRLEDCQPDVLQLLHELFAACPLLLLKLSPMADISLVCKQLGCVRDVHVVCSEGECKELLLLLERGYNGEYGLTVYDNGAIMPLDQVHPLSGRGYILGAGPSPGTVPQTPMEAIVDGLGPGGKSGLSPNLPWTRSTGGDLGEMILFEPGKGLLKAGAFDLPCRYGLEKLGRHTHLYVGESVPEELRPFGKVFRVLEALPLNNRNIKAVGQKYPQAEVTARNIPLTSDQLRAKLGVRSGGTVHIFGVQVDASASHWLIIAQK